MGTQATSLPSLASLSRQGGGGVGREGGAAQLPPESYDVTYDPRLKQALSFEESSSSIIIPTETSIVACCERVRCDAQPPTLPPNKPTPLFYAFAISQRNS